MALQNQNLAKNGGTQTNATQDKADRFQREFDALLLSLIGIGLVAAMIYGGWAQSCPVGAASVGRCGLQAVFVGILLALFIALGALAVGTFIGFLFGLPRSLTSSEFRAARQQVSAANAAGAAAVAAAGGTAVGDGGSSTAPAPGTSAEVNTNLEKISDWLTTIIVGVGLTKLQEIPGSIESFGDRVEPFFNHGGKVFGIGGGLLLLIGGFFLAYFGTRVRLSLIFILSQWINRSVAQGVVSAAIIEISTNSGVFAPDAVATPGVAVDLRSARDDENLKQADEVLLSKSLSDLKTPAEIIAWANAKARSGDYASALTAYKDVWGRVPFTDRMQTDYAAILAATGDTAGANNVLAAMATAGNLTADAERDARQKIAAASDAGHFVTLRNRLQQGLYRVADRGYEESIVAGEEYF
jgi:hypothetical protein